MRKNHKKTAFLSFLCLAVLLVGTMTLPTYAVPISVDEHAEITYGVTACINEQDVVYLELALDMTANPGIADLMVSVSYDDATLAVSEWTDGKLLGGLSGGSSADDNPYYYRWQAVAGTASSKRGTLLTVRFGMVPNGVTLQQVAESISVMVETATDASGNAVDITLTEKEFVNTTGQKRTTVGFPAWAIVIIVLTLVTVGTSVYVLYADKKCKKQTRAMRQKKLYGKRKK